MSKNKDTQTEKLNLTEPITSIEEYTFEPIKGYPMLNWKGKRPFRSTQFFPAQLKENHGEPVNNWMNEIFWGDNLQVMSHLLKKYRGQVQLIYIDPPFDSKAEYKKNITLKGKTVSNDHSAFEEKQYSDIWTNDEYLQFVYERLILMKELLADNGSVWIHCDYHKNHYIKSICDEIFSSTNFITEIIWKRSTPRGNVKRGLSVAHDNVYVYGKTIDTFWNPPKLDYSDEYLARFAKSGDDGRKYTLDSMISPNPDRPNLDYEWNGVRKVWRVTKDKMKNLVEEGRIEYTSNGVARYKRYLDELEGMPLTTIWDDIDPVNSQAKEREDYPTQKPERLLDRIIKSTSNPGDLVFDCFMGSGTTQAVAMKLGRRFIGADINLGAIQITTKRLINIAKDLKDNQESDEPKLIADEDGENKIDTWYTGFSVYNVNNYDIFRNPVQAKELLIEALEIQPLPSNTIYDGEKDGRMVKIMPVNRIATKADLNDLITNFDYKTFEKRNTESPGKAVESLLLVCMGHEPDLKAALQNEIKYTLDVEIVDILRDKAELQFKRDSEADIKITKNKLEIKKFYPMNLLQKLSLMKEKVDDWRELVESVMIDWNYDGSVFEPTVVDVPGKNELVQGKYKVPEDAGTIKVKITDLLSESLEVEVVNG